MTWLIITIFLIGYTAIATEHYIHIDKAASALVTGILCWTIIILNTNDPKPVDESLYHHFSEIASILFFLIGAMTIVELIDTYNGFQIVISKIKTNQKRKLFVILTLLTFFFSALFDNLTTAIVMASIIGKLLTDKNDRLIFAGMVIIAANAGGAWSPIGDVTTTMLWIGNQVSTFKLMETIFLPSVICTIIPMFILRKKLQGDIIRTNQYEPTKQDLKESRIILFSGIGLLLFVPVFKTITHLPPFMGMLLSVGLLWMISATMERRSPKHYERAGVLQALEKVDMPSVLFFAGILLAVSALQTQGILNTLSVALSHRLPNENALVTFIGMLSAIFDNVPLVAALQAMYDYPLDHSFWHYLAYCAGTGGSLLIIGSAAGVAIMGIEKIDFFVYLKKISWVAFIGFLAGCLSYVLTFGL